LRSGEVGRSAGGEQCGDDAGIGVITGVASGAGAEGEVERGPAFGGRGVEVGVGFEEGVEGFGGMGDGGGVEGAPAVGGRPVGIGLVIEEEGDEVGTAVVDGGMEWGAAVSAAGVDVGLGAQEGVDDLAIGFDASEVEGGPAGGGGLRDVGVGAGVEEGLDYGQRAAKNGKVERGIAGLDSEGCGGSAAIGGGVEVGFGAQK
jgi:hypothetical protein